MTDTRSSPDDGAWDLVCRDLGRGGGVARSRLQRISRQSCRWPDTVRSLALIAFCLVAADSSLLCADAARGAADQADETSVNDSSATTPRQQIVRLLTEIHSADPSEAAAARQQLGNLGIGASQLRYARLLKHPLPDARLELIRLLPNVPQPLQHELHNELLRDPDAEVRQAAAERTLIATSGDSALSDGGPTLELAGFTKSSDGAIDGQLRPEILNRPIEPQLLPDAPLKFAEESELLTLEMDPPRGFTGPSGILSSDVQKDSHFAPVPDRWRLGYPRTDRYGASYPWTVDYIGVPGHWWDPYNQNVLKGDFPIIGQHTFMNLTATSQTLFDFREVPTPTTPFESTRHANQQ